MADTSSQPDLDPAAMGPIIEALKPLMPALARLVDAWRQQELRTAGQSELSPAQASYAKGAHGLPPDALDQDLPRLHQGRSRHENLTGFYPDTLYEIEKTRRLDVFAEYEACREIFTPEQWETICLYWKEGLTQAEIAETLNLKHSAVSSRLTRAAGRKEAHDKALRKERAEHLRKMQEES
jgi:DNA-directed RNA polymerase specialized sigma24 family protein